MCAVSCVCVGTVFVCICPNGWRGERRPSHDTVQRYPCIYDTRSSEFKVALVKENAWEAIAETLQRTGEIILFVWHM